MSEWDATYVYPIAHNSKNKCFEKMADYYSLLYPDASYHTGPYYH